jgi:hypothetical protein
MQRPQPIDFDQLSLRIEQGHRKTLFRTILLGFTTVAVAAAVLVFTLNAIWDADQKLYRVNQAIEAADAAKEKAQADLKLAQDKVVSLQARVTELNTQVTQSQAQIKALSKQLAEALNLQKQVYNLNWSDLKMMYVDNGSASEILGVIQNLKDHVHWGMSNTAAGGYNSPGFAKLVLQQLHRIPADGELGSLPRDNEPPRVGDIVVYDSGYHLFYFRDHEKREFVIGMTPFGVVSLNYDFDTGRAGVLRTGFTPN